MSYDIYLKDPDSGITIEMDSRHYLKGGNYALGGTTEAWLNVTYNYAKIFRRVLGDEGIRSIYDTTGQDSLPLLTKAIDQLGDDVHPDYWEPTEGNAKHALISLRTLAEMRPDGIWNGD
jgi:hypothetical protein